MWRTARMLTCRRIDQLPVLTEGATKYTYPENFVAFSEHSEGIGCKAGRQGWQHFFRCCCCHNLQQPRRLRRIACPPSRRPSSCVWLRDKNNVPLAMETAIVRFAPAAGGRTPTVDLVAAVHIADAAYYRQLNREFQAYDAVLYELVAPEDSKAPKPGDRRGGNPISALQNGMKDLLALEFQLDGIDYTRKNMVHADMSPEQLARSMHERGESAWTMLGRMMAYAMAKENRSDDVSGGELLAAFFAKNRALALKWLLAEQFQQSEEALAALEGPTGSALD